MAQHSDTSKDAALRAIGRTIVNFQRLEHNLKLAARLGPPRGTVHKIQNDIARRHERAATLTLGAAIQSWLSYIEGTPVQDGVTPDLFDVSIELTFSLEPDAESDLAHANALKALLKQRNDLIHTRLATFQFESPKACKKLVAELDKVNVAIIEQLDYVGSLLAAIVDLHKEHTEAIAAALENGSAFVANGQPDA